MTAITAGYWFLQARCPACCTTGDVDLRALDWHRGAAATTLPRRRAANDHLAFTWLCRGCHQAWHENRPSVLPHRAKFDELAIHRKDLTDLFCQFASL